MTDRKYSDLMKYCSQCGGLLHRRYVAEERRRRSVCARCSAVSYRNPKIVAAALPVRNGRIYLLRRGIEPSLGLWTFPAGFMEMGESVEEAAIRETREEIRCRIKIEGLHRICSYPDSGVVTIVYRARVIGPEPRAGHEAQCVQKFRPEEIPWEELAFLSVSESLRDWVAAEFRG
ncbi:MAG: NUDIX hydrolase [Elusimicrobia bacterium]|nr:NUDIX hydrolase [Elusimicrobiota bacterium]